MYIVYTSQGFTQDNAGNDVENLQILEVIDKDTIKRAHIKTLEDAANYAKDKMEGRYYGSFSSLVVVPAKDIYSVRIMKGAK